MAKILAVEDEPLVLMLVSETLELAGHNLVEASNGQAALDIFKASGDIDVVVTDVRMPKLDGFALAAAIAELRPGTPVIFMTGYTGDQAPADFSDAPILRKPFEPEDLISAVAAAVA